MTASELQGRLQEATNCLATAAQILGEVRGHVVLMGSAPPTLPTPAEVLTPARVEREQLKRAVLLWLRRHGPSPVRVLARVVGLEPGQRHRLKLALDELRHDGRVSAQGVRAGTKWVAVRAEAPVETPPASPYEVAWNGGRDRAGLVSLPSVPSGSTLGGQSFAITCGRKRA